MLRVSPDCDMLARVSGNETTLAARFKVDLVHGHVRLRTNSIMITRLDSTDEHLPKA